MFVTVEPSTGEPQLHIVPNLMSFWQFASTRSDNDPDTSRLGRLQDVREFVKILDHTIVKPVERMEFMVSYKILEQLKFQEFKSKSNINKRR